MTTYNVTMWDLTKEHEKMGLFAFKVTYQFIADSEKTARKIAHRFDPRKRILKVEKVQEIEAK